MFEKLQKVLTDSVLYGLGDAVQKLTGIILIPILTRLFIPAIFGAIDIINIVIMVIGGFVIVGLDVALPYFYFDAPETERIKYVSTSFYYRLITGCIVAVIGMLFSRKISFMLFDSSEYITDVFIAMALIPVMTSVTFFSGLSRLKFKPVFFNATIVLNLILQVAGTVLLIKVFKLGHEGVFLGRLIGGLMVTIVNVVYYRKELKLQIDISVLIKMLKYGYPLVFYSISFWIMNGADRFFLNEFYNLETVGCYSIGLKMASVLSIYTNAVQMAWFPYAMSIKNAPDSKNVYNVVFLIFSTFGGVLILLLMASSRILIVFFATETYLPSIYYVGVLAAIVIANGMYSFIQLGLLLAEKTKWISISAIIASVANLVLNFILIKIMGPIGAGVATLISYIIAIGFVYKMAQKYYFIQYKLGSLMKSGLYFLGAFIYIQINIDVSIFTGVIMNFIIISLYIVVLFLSERENIKDLIDQVKEKNSKKCIEYYPDN